MASRYQDEGIPIRFLNCDLGQMRSPRAFMASRRGLRAVVEEVAPDLIHNHFVGPALFTRLALGRHRGPLRVFQVPGPLHLEHGATRTADLWSAGSTDYWIASCRKTRDIYLSAGIAPERVGFSYYGTDTDALVEARPGRVRPGLGLPSTTRLIGMVAYAYRPKRWLGRRKGIKGHEDLIDAVALLRKERRDVAVVFAGGPWVGAETYFESIKRYASPVLGSRALFLGSRDDVMDIYADLDVAVHPSHSENLGGAVESLLAAVPTVATNVGGLPDIVIPGETGWLCHPRSPGSLASAIGAALDDPAEASKRGLAGRALIKRDLNVNATAAQVADYYRLLLRSGRPAGATLD